jgi:hypothetical protein
MDSMIHRASQIFALCSVLARAAIFATILATPLFGQALAAPAQTTTTAAQTRRDVVGDWQGTLEFPASGSRPSAKYRLVLRVAKSPDGGLTALNYTIDQGPTPMRTADVTL